MLRRTRHPEGHIGWLEHSIAGIAGSIERAVFTEELARQPGWLQRVDPRAKIAMFLIVVIAASASLLFMRMPADAGAELARRTAAPAAAPTEASDQRMG